MQDGDISSIEFHKVLQEAEKYRKRKDDIMNQTKAKVKPIMKEQRKNYLNKEVKSQTLQVSMVAVPFKV